MGREKDSRREFLNHIVLHLPCVASRRKRHARRCRDGAKVSKQFARVGARIRQSARSCRARSRAFKLLDQAHVCLMLPSWSGPRNLCWPAAISTVRLSSRLRPQQEAPARTIVQKTDLPRQGWYQTGCPNLERYQRGTVRPTQEPSPQPHRLLIRKRFVAVSFHRKKKDGSRTTKVRPDARNDNIPVHSHTGSKTCQLLAIP